MAKETATARIVTTKETHQRLKDFANGLNVSQDEAINVLLNQIISFVKEEMPDAFSDEMISGYAFRAKTKKSQK